jgi:ABC-2 type transport system ATP-binding protein
MPCAGHGVSDAVRVSSLVKLYGEVRAVDGIDFRVGTGQVFSFLGPNGAGKTTTVEILEGLRPRSSGDVEVLGLDPWKDVDRIHRKIGIIPQDFKFFEKVTAKEAVDLWANLFGVKADATELLRRVELSDKAGAYYETLSGGQKQKLGLALALVNDPEICFLDEPTTGLDPRARRSIWEVIRGLKSEGRTVFLTTHYLEEAQLLADEIAIINHGKIIVAGTPDALIQKYGAAERLRLVATPKLADWLRAHQPLPVEVTNGAIEIPLQRKEDALRILTLVESSGIPWESFSTRQDTLEDVFLRLVGRMDEEEGTVAGEPIRGAGT